MTLTKQELSLLLDCVDAKESAEKQGSLMGDLFGAILCGKEEGAYEKFKNDRARDNLNAMQSFKSSVNGLFCFAQNFCNSEIHWN